ncbi:MAG: hypothetical protein H7Y16_08860 [Candidatus Parcubacteria bacterium]|nr:hypothetical protein [Burkholderiales bacterium]
MSGGGESAPAPAKAAPAAPVDHVEELAKQIFVQLSAQVHSQPGEKPEHKKLVELSFRLSEAFTAGNFDFNTAARERREAKAKASVDVSKIEIDFGAIGKS